MLYTMDSFFLPFSAEILTLAHGVGTIDTGLICGFPQLHLDLLNMTWLTTNIVQFHEVCFVMLL